MKAYVRKDLTGKRFGRLSVLGLHSRGKNTLWKCFCDCGRVVVVSRVCLSKGASKSCGCWRKEFNRLRPWCHGYTRSPTYWAWLSMRKRCYNLADRKYPLYGGRGIIVDSSWINSFKTFLKDMGEKPKGLTLDRIDNNGNYEPGNCRWTTYRVQDRNKRNNVILTFKGRTECLQDWARITGLKQGTLWHRIRISKWDVEKALTTPVILR